ncbi:MAG: hypothetical protein R2813_04275 [Flavobacteriales bacterium]
MKQSAFTLAVFYLLSIVGYGLEVHYCLGQVTDVNYALLDTSCVCDDTQQVASKGCCEEKEFFIQIEEVHQASAGMDYLNIELPLIEELSWAERFELSEAVEHSEFIEDTGPPLVRSIVIENCSLTLYA